MWHLTHTALLRNPAKPVFLRPWFWPADVWAQCACASKSEDTKIGEMLRAAVERIKEMAQ